jgi:hypothetical protein
MTSLRLQALGGLDFEARQKSKILGGAGDFGKPEILEEPRNPRRQTTKARHMMRP